MNAIFTLPALAVPRLDPVQIDTLLLRAVTKALAVGTPGPLLAAGIVRGGLAPWQIRRVARFIADNISRSISVGDLAGLVRLSTSHFSRACRASFGISPYALISRRRVEHAKHLLLSTSHSLAAIAADCGYADQSHLSRQFRRSTSTSPGRWRRQPVPALPLAPNAI